MSSDTNDADGSTSPLSLHPPPLTVHVEPATHAPKMPLQSVHEEAEHLYPAVIEWSRPCESVGVTGSFNK